MRWCAALAIVLSVLLVATVRVAFHKSCRAVHPSEANVNADADDGATEAEAAPALPPPHRAETLPRTVARLPPPRPRPPDRPSVAAFLHGRVVIPPGAGDVDDLGDLEVIADDGVRTVRARLTSGGRFAFHLPPGRYTLFAESGDFGGATPDVLARGDEEREIDIQLGPAVTISGTLRAPDGAEVAASVRPVGGSHPKGLQSVEAGRFTLRGLIAGRRYDLSFGGPAVRTATLRAVLAPANALEIALHALPIVRGAIGFPRGETCPIETVSLHGAGIKDGDDDAHVDVDSECRFELTPPEGASDLTVVAEGPGFRLEDLVSLPAQGDPDPICLNPPCRSDAGAI